MQLNKEFVPYNIASDLKELGFDEPCFIRVWWLNDVNNDTKRPFVPRITIYGKDIDFEYPMPESHPSSGFDALELQVPTFSQCFRWFREKYNLLVSPFQSLDDKTDQVRDYYFEIGKVGNLNVIVSTDNFQTYEEAELACLIKLIEIVKDELGS